MLSIGKLAVGQEAYYLNAVAHGAEDYYVGEGEVPGRWTGNGADLVGLAGEVSDDAFRALLAGINPIDGEALGQANRRIPAFDLTFSAPKSVSVLWALAEPPWVAEQVVAAHEAALHAALGYLEREAVFVRRGHNGTERLLGAGLIGAAFRHRSSRAGDPQLHTHVVVANAAQGPDGRWGALDARHLYAQARTAGFLYQAELRAGLHARLGVEWGPVVKGTADIAGIPTSVLREFSRRRVEIEAVLGAGSTANEARRATLRTRHAKDHTVDAAELHADWVQRAVALGFTAADLEAVLSPEHADVRSQQPSEQRSDHSAVHDRVMPAQPSARGLAVELTEHASSFDRRAVLQAVAGHAQAGATIGELEADADAFLASDQAVPLGVGRYGMCYSTPELLAIEQHLINQALAARDDHVGVVEDLDATFYEYPTLSDEQHHLVETLTSSGAGLDVVVGPAGAGKTYALAAARTAWEANGYTVIGCALAARAAQQLHSDAGIPSCSLDALLVDLDRSDTPGLSWQTVIVVDEAAMVGTRRLARLADHAHAAHAKVVLVGDPHQLPEIEAGGAFTALARRLGAIQLVENRRQTDPVEQHALLELRHGHIDDAIERLAAHGRIITAPTPDAAREQLVDDWYQSRAQGDDTIMLALHRDDVADLNQRARALLTRHGHLDGEQLHIAGRDFTIGDRIITLRNASSSDLVNGQRATIIAIDHQARTLRARFDTTGRIREIPAVYLDYGNVDHAYAMTIHKAQGLTCDRAYVLGDEYLHAEAGYTALSRGRHENRLYLNTPEPDTDHHGGTEPDDPIDVIRDALRRSNRQHIAIDLRTLPDAPMPRSGPEIDYAATQEHDHGIDLGW